MDNPLNPLEAYFRANQGRQINKWPHYFRIYDRHFARFRGAEVSVVEFGVQHGGSLEMWRDYFGPRSRITGVDIDPRCAQFTGDRIEVVTGDQEDREFLRTIASAAGQPDIVIDDGGHSMGQQIATFEEMWPQIRDGGAYLAEDTHTSYRAEYGGGWRRPGAFIEYVKNMADEVNAWHSQDPAHTAGRYARSVAGLHFYDSIVVLDKDTVPPPAPPEVTGRASW